MLLPHVSSLPSIPSALPGQCDVGVRHRRSPVSAGEESGDRITQPGLLGRRPGLPARPVYHHRSQYGTSLQLGRKEKEQGQPPQISREVLRNRDVLPQPTQTPCLCSHL